MDLMTRRRILLEQSAQESGVLATATGNPMTFTTDLVRRLHSLTIPMSNSERSGVIISHAGKNLFDDSGTITHNNYNFYGFVNNLKPNTTYTFSINGTASYKYALYLASALTTTTTRLTSGYIGAGLPNVFITPSSMTEQYLILAGSGNGAGNVDYSTIKPMIEFGNEHTDWQTYSGTTLIINWQTEAGTIINGTATLNEDGSADVVNSDTGNSYHLANVGVITTLEGTNTIWTDTNGTNTAEYWIKNN